MDTSGPRPGHATGKAWDLLLGLVNTHLIYSLFIACIAAAMLLPSHLASLMAWLVGKTD